MRPRCVTTMVVVAATMLSGASAAAAVQAPALMSPAALPPSRADLPPQRIGTNRLVSVRPAGTPAKYQSFADDLSADGRYLAFHSNDGRMVPDLGDPLVDTQLYRRDLRTGTLTLVSRAVDGGFGDGGSSSGGLSADGNLLVFESFATDLVSTPVDETPQIYLYDARTDDITLVSRAPDGTPANARSVEPVISADGTRIAYSTKATNVVPGQPLNPNHLNVVTYDVSSGRHQLVSRGAGGVPTDGESVKPSISADGDRIAFGSRATNLLTVRDDDGPLEDDVFVADVAARTVTQLSSSPVTAEGYSYEPSISADGTHVAFMSYLRGLTDDPYAANVSRIYVADVDNGTFELVDRTVDGSAPAGQAAGSRAPSISADGSFVTYSSYTTNLTDEPNRSYEDVYVYDVAADTNQLVSRTRSGAPATGGGSNAPAISDDGSFITYTSAADDLSPHARDDALNVFVYRRA